MRLIERPRRLRRTKLIRELCAETSFDISGMIQPYFVCEGKQIREPITGLPGINRESVDSLVESIDRDRDIGIKNVMLFGVTDRKDVMAATAMDDDNPAVRAVGTLKSKYGDDLLVSADVCLCAYTDSGHCGVTVDGKLDNDASCQILARMALRLAREGCDIVAPSDMMDGRVGVIRGMLDENGQADTLIMAYTAKYSSAYYGPFREAAGSAPGKGDRRGYQMDFRNRAEALRELSLDSDEGADIVMVKPALAYLDIISDFREVSSLPVAAYNVSGEYAAVKLLAQAGLADERSLTIENLTAIKRAGASIILTYHLRDILSNGWNNADNQ